MTPLEVHFDHGTLVVTGSVDDDEVLQELLELDARTGHYRAPAQNYRDIVLRLRATKTEYADQARKFGPLGVALEKQIEPYPHQQAALTAWTEGGARGIVELPTGAGKTILAVLAIAQVDRPTLVVVPTIDLLQQWAGVLEAHFGQKIGMLGGGEKERLPITVTTYDSAAFQTEFHGNQFGFLVCDECHHLPAPAYQFIASGSIAPYRLGLTATLARPDGGEHACAKLLGPLCYSLPIDALEGKYLAPYDIEHIEVELTESELAEYERERAMYLGFLRGCGLSYSNPHWWGQFIARAARSKEGRRALAAYRNQRRVAFTCSGKLEALWAILLKHRHERIIVFTEDNETVYRLSRLLLMPVITHHTKVKERKRLLGAFAEGELPVLLTSKVLNEGVDVPDANVGVILSGSGSVREHVQRLGRILRKRPNKKAVLYEVCTNVSAEAGVSERRRQHRAYMKGARPEGAS